LKWPWQTREHAPDDDQASRNHLLKAQADEQRVAHIVEQINHKIRENHFGPKFAAALREGRR